jgi:general secretion pathway protein D
VKTYRSSTRAAAGGGILLCALLFSSRIALSQGSPPVLTPAQDSVMLRLVNTELRAAVQVMAQYLDRPVLFGGPAGTQVTLETPQPVPRANVLRLLRGLLESQNYELVSDTAAGLYRARLKVAPPPASIPGGAAGTMRNPPPSAGELFVIQLKHAKATEVAQTVSALYGRAGSGVASNAQAQTLGEQLRSNLVAPVGGAAAGVPVNAATHTTALSGDITVVADPRGNNLLVRANQADFELIQSLVSKLDVRPLQVLIEVVIAEVQRNGSLGINVSGVLNPTTVAGTGSTVSSTLGTAGLGDFAMNVMKLGGLDLDATLTLASDRGDVKILTRPVVLTANNQRAEIVVGSQQPFVQLQRTLPTDNAAQDQVVQYEEVGTKLTVLPTISPDGTVQLEVTQEVSNATGATAFNAPVISTRSVKTDLLIADGHAVVLGGLTDRQKSTDQGGLPFLSSIPVIGGLFGHSTKTTNETELFIFLTPHIIRTDEDAAKLSAPMQERAAKVQP